MSLSEILYITPIILTAIGAYMLFFGGPKPLPKDDAYYITCKTAEQRTKIIELLKSNGFVTDEFVNNNFDTHPNIQVHQSDYMADYNRAKFFNVWSLTPNGVNTGTLLPIYNAKRFV